MALKFIFLVKWENFWHLMQGISLTNILMEKLTNMMTAINNTSKGLFPRTTGHFWSSNASLLLKYLLNSSAITQKAWYLAETKRKDPALLCFEAKTQIEKKRMSNERPFLTTTRNEVKFIGLGQIGRYEFLFFTRIDYNCVSENFSIDL